MVRRTALTLVASLLLALVVMVGGSGPAAACSCVPDLDELAAADVVFAGEVADISDDDGEGSVSYRFEVDTIYKGQAAAQVDVTSQASSAACGYEFEAGRYLVYATRGDDGLRTGACAGTMALDADEAVPADLGEGHRPEAAEGTPAPSGGTSGHPPIGGPDGDVVDPSIWTEYRTPLIVLGLVGLAGMAGVVVAVGSRRRRA